MRKRRGELAVVGRERERMNKEHLETWKKVVHLKPDKLLLVLPDLMVYNSHATFMAKDMCTSYTGTAHPHSRANRGHGTWDLSLWLLSPMPALSSMCGDMIVLTSPVDPF